MLDAKIGSILLDTLGTTQVPYILITLKPPTSSENEPHTP